MELFVGLVCNGASLSPEGKLDVQGAFNDLFAHGFPAKQERMTLVLGMEWDREDDGRYQFRVDLEDPSGRPILTLDGHTDVDRRPADRPPPRTRLIMPLQNVIFPQPGRYRFMVRLKGTQLAGPALHLLEAPPTSSGPPSGSD